MDQWNRSKLVEWLGSAIPRYCEGASLSPANTAELNGPICEPLCWKDLSSITLLSPYRLNPFLCTLLLEVYKRCMQENPAEKTHAPLWPSFTARSAQGVILTPHFTRT